jgi:hypothetical protein
VKLTSKMMGGGSAMRRVRLPGTAARRRPSAPVPS